MNTQEQAVVTAEPQSTHSKFLVEQSALRKGLLKLRGIWADHESGSNMKYVLFRIQENELLLRASSGVVTADIVVPLYERCVSPGVVCLVGDDIWNLVNLSGSLIKVSIEEDHSALIESDKFEWTLAGSREVPLGTGFNPPPGADCEPTYVPNAPLQEALRVCRTCASTDASQSNVYGIRVTSTGAESTDDRRLAVFRAVMGPTSFTVPTPTVPILMALLESAPTESVQIRHSYHQVEVRAGLDVLVFSPVSGLRELGDAIRDMETVTPIVEIDLNSFMVALKRSALFGDGLMAIQLKRSGDDIVITALKEGRKIGEGRFRVSWKIEAPEFSATVVCKLLDGILDALSGKVVKLGASSHNDRPFICISEDDRKFILMERSAPAQ